MPALPLSVGSSKILPFFARPSAGQARGDCSTYCRNTMHGDFNDFDSSTYQVSFPHLPASITRDVTPSYEVRMGGYRLVGG